MVEIKVPELGESIQEVQISHWLKGEGQWVDKDEEIVEVESEKASQSLSAPAAGILEKILFGDGQFAKVGEVIAQLKSAPRPNDGDAPKHVDAPKHGDTPSQVVAAPTSTAPSPSPAARPAFVMPAAERALHEAGIPASQVAASGPGNRILKEDVQRAVRTSNAPTVSDVPAASATTKPSTTAATPPAASTHVAVQTTEFAAELDELSLPREDKLTPMSMIRRTIAARLVEAQRTAALLTTFNEIDMLPVMELRKKYQEPFQQKHGVKLGFMSFFAKAAVEALKRFPAINSEIRGTDVVSRNYYDIGIAIGGGKGLLVPVLRNVQRMSFADIERRIGRLSQMAQENKITPTDLEGGTFTISNGGIYGSLLSTPIVNPPQSGILGLHAIQQRPVAIDNQVVIRPMMYVALTYDHRLVDGREAVGFLRTIKEVLEEPARLFLEV